MKKLFVAILAVFYLSLTSGVMINVHYCMGQLASVDYGPSNDDKCGRCGMADDNKACCHTDSKLVKLQDDHKQSVPVFSIKQADALHTFTPLYNADVAQAIQPISSGTVHSPPETANHTIYLYNCVFRI